MEKFEPNEPVETPVDIKKYIYMFWSSAWMIILAGLIAGAVGYVISNHTKPVYQASTSLLVIDPSTISSFNPSALVPNQTITSTFAEMLLDRSVLQDVIDQLKLQTTPEDLNKSIKVNAVINTQLLVVTVENTNPTQAVVIANEIDQVFTNRINQLQSQRLSTSRDNLAKQITDMEGRIKVTNQQIVNIRDQSTLQELQAQLTQYQTIYSNLVTSYQRVRLAEEQSSTNILVSEPATVSTIPVRPKTILNTLIAMVAAMLLAAGVVFVADALDDTIKSPEEVRRIFGLPILGIINQHMEPEGKPIALAEPRSPTAEAFRSLRTNIKYAAVGKPIQRILITSAAPKDGKTTVACNLAVVLSQSEKRVLLLDADLHWPHVQVKFGLQNSIGLSDLFVHPMEDLPSVVQTVVTSMAIITSGGLPPDPYELLSSSRMSQILDRLNQAYELIIVDSPPIFTVTDSAALAPAMDGVILVAKPGKTKLGGLKQALEELQTVGANVLGVVLNEVNPSSRKYGYYFSRYGSKYSHLNNENQLGGGRSRDIRGRRTGIKGHDDYRSGETDSENKEAAVLTGGDSSQMHTHDDSIKDLNSD